MAHGRPSITPPSTLSKPKTRRYQSRLSARSRTDMFRWSRWRTAMGEAPIGKAITYVIWARLIEQVRACEIHPGALPSPRAPLRPRREGARPPRPEDQGALVGGLPRATARRHADGRAPAPRGPRGRR